MTRAPTALSRWNAGGCCSGSALASWLSWRAPSWRPLAWPKRGPERLVSWPRPAPSPGAACSAGQWPGGRHLNGSAWRLRSRHGGGSWPSPRLQLHPGPFCAYRPGLLRPACTSASCRRQTGRRLSVPSLTRKRAPRQRYCEPEVVLFASWTRRTRNTNWPPGPGYWSQSRPSAVRWRDCNGASAPCQPTASPFWLTSARPATPPAQGSAATRCCWSEPGKDRGGTRPFWSFRYDAADVTGIAGPTAEGAETLRNQVRAIRAQMRSAGFVCEGVLDAAGAATAIGGFLVAGLNQNPGAFPWPLAVEEHWSEVRTEGCWHRTFWVAEWPRSRIGPDFLSPLLVGTARRSVSVVMAPIPPERAARDAESSRTAEVADAQLRAQGGFLQTARQRRQSEALEGRETELADGRGAFELAGYITVSASDKPGLEEAASELERAAGAAKLSLRPLYGQQKEALGWALPFGRGI